MIESARPAIDALRQAPERCGLISALIKLAAPTRGSNDGGLISALIGHCERPSMRGANHRRLIPAMI
jgi:hypothetical protein